ncbi:hypothetical protein V1514DRAFT_298307 [Lipomyces japonicus]|uniref:uncharacterized protein n=1 Tax=Lipomyces japonicus TaxID=56871 RepID=UPI0034CDCAC0
MVKSNETLLTEAAASGQFDETADWTLFRTFLVSNIEKISNHEFTPAPTNEQRIYLAGLIDTFNDIFDDAPPFTLQRLAELILYPQRHYGNSSSSSGGGRELSGSRDKYLRALERVLSVTSRTTDFQLPDTNTVTGTTGHDHIVNGNGDAIAGTYLQASNNEMVILSPISWLIDTGTPPPEDEEIINNEHDQLDSNNDLITSVTEPEPNGQDLDRDRNNNVLQDGPTTTETTRGVITTNVYDAETITATANDDRHVEEPVVEVASNTASEDEVPMDIE